MLGLPWSMQRRDCVYEEEEKEQGHDLPPPMVLQGIWKVTETMRKSAYQQPVFD